MESKGLLLVLVCLALTLGLAACATKTSRRSARGTQHPQDGIVLPLPPGTEILNPGRRPGGP